MSVSTEAKLACVERELKLRQKVYARLVETHKMSPDRAEHEIACMRAIMKDYESQLDKERLL